MNMKKGKRMILKVFLGLIIGFGAFCILCILFIYVSLFGSERKRVQQLQVRLLCDIDHQVLLEGCREVLRMYARGDLKRSKYWIRENHGTKISHFPTASSEKVCLPQVILDLEPTYINIDQSGRVMLEMLGGLHHFGVYAYPEDYKYKEPISAYGDKELIPGLWYYNDGYQETPDYGKKIDALIEKYKKKREK